MGRIPSLRRHSSGQARVTINGQTHYLGRYGSKASRQRYDGLLAEWLASGRSRVFGMEPAQMTVGELIVDYLDHCKRYYGTKESSELHQAKLVCRALVKLYRDLPAVEFGPAQFKALRQTLVDDPSCQRTAKCTKAIKPLSRPYVNGQMKRVCRMFKWAAGEGKLPAAVYDQLRLVPGLKRGRTAAPESSRVLPVDEAVVARTIEACSPVVGDMIRFQLLTGCRPGEVCMLTPSMIDRSGDVWVARLDEHKTAHHGRERLIYIGPEAQVIITPYLLRGEQERLFSPAESEAKRRALLNEQRKTRASCGNRPGYSKRTREGRKSKKEPGTSYDSQSYQAAIRYACKKAGIEPWAPNQLRHAAATEIRKRYGLEGSQVILGHSKADVTQVYAELDQRRAIEIALRDFERRVG